MLEVTNLEKKFRSGKSAFKEMNFNIEPASIVGILGTSGCGKSSLLRVLSGLDSASSGEVLLEGSPLRGLDPRVNLVFQEPRLLPWLNVRENVLFGITKDTSPEDARTQVTRALKQVGMDGYQALYPKQCSGGMAQRTALARALVRTPEVLLLDEPFSALDAFIRMQLQDILLEIHAQSKATMILVTHDIDEALYLCDRIMVFRGQPGRLVRDMKVELPRPRHRGDPWLGQAKEEILELLDLAKHHEEDLTYYI